MSAQERWGIIGANGSGKTSLLTLITGNKAPHSGTLTRGKNTEVAYFDQHRTSLDPNALVENVLVPEGGDTVFFMGAPIHIRSWLQRFAFAPDAQRMRVFALSGGERNRLALAKLMLTQANLLILDEPTNDLDLLTLNVLEDALLHYPGCVIVVSHDRYFLDKVATHTLSFVPPVDPGGPSTIRIGTGGYTAQLQRLQAEAKAAAPSKERDKGGKAGKQSGAKKPRRSYKEERELEGMEGCIEAKEAEVAALEEALLQPEIWQTNMGAEGQRLTAALAEAQAQARDLYARWQTLMDLG